MSGSPVQFVPAASGPLVVLSLEPGPSPILVPPPSSAASVVVAAGVPGPRGIQGSDASVTAGAVNAAIADSPSATLAALGIAATYIQPTAPSDTTAHLWVQTGLGSAGTDFTLWIEDGE